MWRQLLVCGLPFWSLKFGIMGAASLFFFCNFGGAWFWFVRSTGNNGGLPKNTISIHVWLTLPCLTVWSEFHSPIYRLWFSYTLGRGGWGEWHVAGYNLQRHHCVPLNPTHWSFKSTAPSPGGAPSRGRRTNLRSENMFLHNYWRGDTSRLFFVLKTLKLKGCWNVCR